MCPIVYVDGEETEMLNRSSINNGGHNETVCELTVQTSAKNISIEDLRVPILPKRLIKLLSLVTRAVE